MARRYGSSEGKQQGIDRPQHHKRTNRNIPAASTSADVGERTVGRSSETTKSQDCNWQQGQDDKTTERHGCRYE